MTDRHLDEHALVELALGFLSEPERSRALGHTAVCPDCRSTLEDVVAAVDLVLPATPPADPPAGLDEAVLGQTVAAGTPEPVPGRPRWHLAVAAGLAGLLAGAGLTLGVRSADDDAPVAESPAATAPSTGPDAGPAGPGTGLYPDLPEAAVSTAPLVTSAGEEVGTVHRSALRDQPVLVMQVSGAPPGVSYECRLLLADGSKEVAASWQVPADGEALWLLPSDPAAIAVELAVPGNAPWARADLTR